MGEAAGREVSVELANLRFVFAGVSEKDLGRHPLRYLGHNKPLIDDAAQPTAIFLLCTRFQSHPITSVARSASGQKAKKSLSFSQIA
jgi:hypothetical protein